MLAILIKVDDMSRVIKFRAFDPKNGMIEPYSVRNGKAFIIKRCNKDDPTVTVDGVNFYCNWDIDVATDFPVMQFTGLLDVDGMEIYEGDIVEVKSDGEFVFNHEVKWIDSHGCYVIDAIHGYEHVHTTMPWAMGMMYYSYKVIGNIYQNPELLK